MIDDQGRVCVSDDDSATVARTLLDAGVAGVIATNTTIGRDGVDPSDDCTIWYVGDYYKAGATNYSTRIGAFRMPGCGG